jgi:glycosyltransferase involved in cell wall biosynthesis
VYRVCTCLIAASLGEGFGLPLVEAALHGVPVVARDIPVFREVAGVHAYYFEGQGADDLARALLGWLSLYAQGRHPRPDGSRWATWRDSAERLGRLLTRDDYARRQLFVDVSEIVRHDASTGIQRVVRNVLSEWLQRPPAGWRMEPVYADIGSGYRYARRFTHRFLEQPEPPPDDDLIEYAPGDLFFVLDMQPQVQIAHRGTFLELRRHGVGVRFLVYDLLPVQLPHRFPPGTRDGFEAWLRVVGESDGAVCISKSAADDLHRWFCEKAPAHGAGFDIDWFHLGADIHQVGAALAGVATHSTGLEGLRGKTTFLMVGTLEPRKGHSLVLDAFEQLWLEGLELNLVIVGKEGWMVEELGERLRKHQQRGERLLWLQGVSDEQLEAIYAKSHCLIAASEGEGFGLPIVEAAARGLPIVARDIPVFREVAGAHAHYFDGSSRERVAGELHAWLAAFEAGRHVRSGEIPRLTWRMSAERLLQLIAGRTSAVEGPGL